MKILKLVSVLLLLTLASTKTFAIGNNKTLMVEYFGTNIFRIVKDNNFVLEREVELLQSANSYGYNNLRLKRVDELKYGNNNLLLIAN